MRNILNRIAVLIVTLCVFLTGARSFSAVAAEENKTASGVLEDLSKDASFNSANYPSAAKDYSLQIIQLAVRVGYKAYVMLGVVCRYAKIVVHNGFLLLYVVFC